LKGFKFDINDKEYNKILQLIKKLNSKKHKKQLEEINEKIEKLEKQINTHTWHISGLINIKEAYKKVSKVGKTYIYDKVELDGIIFKGTKDEAIAAFKNEMFKKYERDDPSPEVEYRIKDIQILSIVKIDDKVTKKEDMKMKQASQLEYNFINEYKDFLQNNGTCVIDNFIGMYGEKLTISRKNFIYYCKEYYKQYNIDWKVEDGVSPKCVNSICERYDISHYALDINKSCFVKYISKNRNNKALVYFAINGHMYLILDDAVRKSLIKEQK